MTALLARAMGDAFGALPALLQRLHSPDGATRWVGEALVELGSTVQARTLARMAGFPTKAGKVPFTLTITADGRGETWRRTFGDHVMTSRVWPGPRGSLAERLGATRLFLAPSVTDGHLRLEARRMRFLGMPAPGASGGGTEGVDDQGRVTFDVSGQAPVLGRLIRYSGHLTPT